MASEGPYLTDFWNDDDDETILDLEDHLDELLEEEKIDD
jgi:hypothetical protein